MKKYVPILVVVCFVLSVLGFSTIVLKQQQADRAAEAYRQQRHLIVWSDLPGDVNQVLARSFHSDTGMRVQIETYTDDQIKELAQKKDYMKSGPDYIIAAEPVLKNLQKASLLSPYASVVTESVPYAMKDADGYWTGLWYDSMVFVIGTDYYARRGDSIDVWGDLLTDPQMVLAFPDLAATDMAGDYLCSFIEVHGIEETGRYYRALQGHVSSYTKSMSAIVRRVAAGEAHVGVADALTARQFEKEKAPIVIVYPQDGTSYWLYGGAVTNWNADAELVSLFSDWLLSRSALATLHNHKIYLTTASDVLPKELDSRNRYPVPFSIKKIYTDEGRKEMQDWWIRTIRFGKE